MRTEHDIPLYQVRTALDYFEQEFKLPHPLVRVEFQTDGVDLFLNEVGKLINVSRSGQLAIRQTLEDYLKRIERDETGLAAKLVRIQV
jgi:hypothetical protein